ncbi:Ras guanine nucleotide exchange factor A [Lachnellula arida]|uniref:Ras guanine nucleotide exchange factor A n=1 Tax=Lachnellula arida TaxID=1316785 RepID=A0A8T9B529_9HELO|nr:Ras guanine nucleotide exchange factor A [Lachnellula arida]
MNEVGGLPARHRSMRAHSRDPHRGERKSKSNSTAQPAPPVTRTSSEPVAASPSKDSKYLTLSFDHGSNGHDQRDSITSVQDDPFFRNYQSPHSVSLAKELRSATYLNRYRDDGTPGEPPPRSPNRPLVDNAVKLKLPILQLQPQSRSGMSDINIAIIGSAGVGKSTLIQRALGLRALPTSIASSLRMSVDNVVYTVSLIELDLESFDIAPDRRIEWPKQINGHIVPRMDGALLLYDVMNRESISELPQTLKGLVNSSLPTILVSCKCDNPENTRQLDVENMEALCVSCVEAVKTAENVPESARLGLSSILRAIMSKRNGYYQRPRSAWFSSSSHFFGPSRNTPGSSQAAQPALKTQPSKFRVLTSPRFSLAATYILTRSFATSKWPDQSSSILHPRSTRSTTAFVSSSLPNRKIAATVSRRPVDSTLLDMEESDADPAYRYSDDIPILQRNDDSFFDKPAKVSGVTFDELVDRLLGQNMSRADDNFSDIFLCLYRKFAAPGELFKAILKRLERIALDKNTHYLTRTATQLRILAVLARWVSGYPGDFASPSTSQKLNTFIGHLNSEPVFAAAAQDMRTQLQSRVVEDDDTGWARTDADVESETSSKEESEPASPLRRKLTESSDIEEDMQTLSLDEESGEDMESQQSRGDSESRSLAPSFHTVEDYEREAATMIPKATLPLTKFRYHIFMDTHDDYVADEMTRIDWVMFSSIRLRDLVRHVSLSLEQKERCKSLANVNRMINHFNHIARWVANMILMRDKAKHRAQMLEKFMTVALKLRQLNNYNGLAAVLAGINGTAVHRLAQTRALVPADVQKRFARLVLLMGSQKSHFAYRLAWENSPLPRIPFIPLHRRDLVSAEEGSRTFVGADGDRINWKKFEVLSEVILPIMKSQVLPYPNLAKHDIARELILDCRMPVDDEVNLHYKLSCLV